MENQIKFTKEQLQSGINLHLSEDSGLNDLLTMVLNGLMYSEREAFLKSEDPSKNKGNGYRSLLKSGIGSGVELKIPRDRLGVFRPVILGVLEQQEERIKDLSFSLYGKGLTTRQISDILEDIYGTSYSKSSVSRITKEYQEVIESWLNRGLEDEYSIIYIDAMHVKVRRDVVRTEAFYVVLGVKQDLTREVLTVVNFPTESAQGWQEVLKSLKQRGLTKVELVVSDDLTGLDQAIDKEFKTNKQKCILHFQRNLSKRIRVNDRKEFCQDIKSVFNPDDKDYTPEMAQEALKLRLTKWEKRYPSLKKIKEKPDIEQLFTYLKYEYRVRRMIYTTNWIERLNKSFRRTLKIRNALPSIDSVMILMGSVAIEMERNVYKYPVTSFKFESKFSSL